MYANDWQLNPYASQPMMMMTMISMMCVCGSVACVCVWVCVGARSVACVCVWEGSMCVCGSVACVCVGGWV